jgi:hypothetical protein
VLAKVDSILTFIPVKFHSVTVTVRRRLDGVNI